MGISEAQILEIVREMLEEAVPGLEVGIGDDAAIFHFAREGVVLTVDSFYEGVHFNLDYFGYADVGWKSLAAGISDVAAMGGEPSCALVSLAFDEPPEESDVRSLLEGLRDIAREYDMPIVGGDVCRSSCGLGVSVTVAGTVHPSGAVLRSGAQEGDFIGVTGRLGDSAGGLAVLLSGDDSRRTKFAPLVRAHLRPRPMVAAGTVLADYGATAMEDVSDGLAADLVHICEQSGVGCSVEAEQVPLSGELMILAEEERADPLEWALVGGEDYNLVFTAPEDRFLEASAALTGQDVIASHIGTVTAAGEGMMLRRRDGTVTDMRGKGYDHFLR